MKLRFVLIAFAFIALSVNANAQLIWHVKQSDVGIGPTDKYSIFEHSCVSCFGDNCTVGANVTDTSNKFKNHLICLYRTTDGGLTWAPQIPSQSLFPIGFNSTSFSKIQQIDSLNVVVCGDSGLVLKTTDAGTHWAQQTSPTNFKLRDIHFSNPLEGIACDGSNAFTTSDGGIHWNLIPIQNHMLFQCHSYGNGKFRVFSRGLGPIFTTTDNFTTVDSSTQILDTSKVSDWYRYIFVGCTFGGDTILAYGACWDTSNTLTYGLIVRSVDGGNHWEKPFTYDPHDSYFGSTKYTTQLDRDTIVAGGGSVNSYILSFDKGATWQVADLKLDTAYSVSACFGLSMAANNRAVAIFSPFIGQSIIARGEWGSSGIDILPEMVFFNQHIFPNPANGNVTILVGVQSMPIGIYDMLGREVVREMLPESGKLTLNLSDYPAGAYNVLLYDHKRTIPLGKIMLIGK